MATTGEQWRRFFLIAREILGEGADNSRESKSWCGWTTFTRLKEGVYYWEAGMPPVADILETGIRDGGLWDQSFSYLDLAHVVVPATFFWETAGGPMYENGIKSQNIQKLSEQLGLMAIPHRCTDLVLEIKKY